MARDPGYSFESSDSRQSADWRRRHAGGRPPALTPDERRIAEAFRDEKPAAAAAAPAPGMPEQQHEARVAIARSVTALRGEPDEDGKTPCARGDWCTSYQVVTDEGGTRRVPEYCYQAFCPKDRGILAGELEQLPAQFVYLAAEIGNPVRDGQVVHVPFGPRIPIRIDVDALMRAIEESLSSWHERVADVDQLSYPYVRLSRLQRQMASVHNAERVLIHRIEPMLALGPMPMGRTLKITSERDPKGRATEDVYEFEMLDGTDAGMEIFTLRWLCRAMLGETRAKPEELLGVPCRREECDQLALRRAELPSDPKAPVWWSECASCDDRLTEEEYRDWTWRYARWAEGKTVPVLENLPGVA